MYCKKCGKDYPKNKKVCKDCGIALMPGKSQGNKKNGNKRLFIVGGALLVVIIAVFLIIGLGGMVPDQLKGTWYDTMGLSGTVEFKPAGAVEYTMFGALSTGTYSYNGATKEGTMKIKDANDAQSFTCDGTTLTMGTVIYTKEYKEQAAPTAVS